MGKALISSAAPRPWPSRGRACKRGWQRREWKAYSACTRGRCATKLPGRRPRKPGKAVAIWWWPWAAAELGTRLLWLPSSISTCAAYTPFSLLYTPDGRAIPGNYCYPLENAAILVDLDIMAAQPARYVIAGALDAMAKRLEIRNRSHPLNLRSRTLAQMAG